MAERGATPVVPAGRRRALELLRSFTAPREPDEYLELLNPLWSTRELRGRVEAVERESALAATVTIKPGWEWPGHRPGQYVRLGVQVDGVHHWRAYSLTSDPCRRDGCITITPKLVEQGRVSPFLTRRLRRGEIVRLGGVEGDFVLPEPVPQRLLLVSAGSGITPIMSMLRSLAGRGSLRDAVHVHCERTPEGIIFGGELRALAREQNGYRLHEWISGRQGRLPARELDRLCPDWRERETFACGPGGLLDAIRDRFEREGERARLHVEHFQPDAYLGEHGHGAGGSIRFSASGMEASSDGRQPILLAGEGAGATLPHGCRMGICHSCLGRLQAGRVRDLRSGRIHGQAGELVQTCVNAPEGPIEIEL